MKTRKLQNSKFIRQETTQPCAFDLQTY